MKQTRNIMGMPVVIEIVDGTKESQEKIFNYLVEIDKKFSTYKTNSEISKINRAEITEEQYSSQMKEVLALCEETKQQSHGYFDIRTPKGTLDPSGLVKGWAIRNAARLAQSFGHENFWIEAGGDIQTLGINSEGGEWRVGIRNPYNTNEIIKVVYPRGAGIATSGTIERGNHIYNPHTLESAISDLISLTVIGTDVYEADRFATAAFAMGTDGLLFIERLPWCEAYAVNTHGVATMTSNFVRYLTASDLG